MVNVFVLRDAIDQDVVKVNNAKEVKMFAKCVIHEVLEHG